MHVLTGLCVTFAVPSQWTSFRDGARHVFQGPLHEELIVSGHIVEARNPTPVYPAALQELLEAARRAMSQSAAHPELDIDAPIQRVVLASGLSAWLLHAHAKDGSVLFSQAVVAHDFGVALFTFEAPLTNTSRDHFWFILNSVGPTETTGAGA